MIETTPFLLDNIDELRKEILALDNESGKRSQLWSLIINSARRSPLDFGWYVPFVAVITREKQDIDNARKIIFTYLDKLEPMRFCSGLQFHFWCFAFPHAKVSMYFQWLCTIGAFSREEKKDISDRLIEYHFTNFYYGMLTKPEPECVDNQALSLCLSNAMVGAIFSRGENPSSIAKIMLRDGLRRLPDMIGDMPLSGYSGEGSAYMDCVNGPAIPLSVELLEYLTGENGLLFQSMGKNGAKPLSVLKMVAREFMPGGLLLPWDNYGYQFGVRSPIAYGARKTGKGLFFRVLEEECIWTYDIGIGWAYDDLVWTLIWWPSNSPVDTDDGVIWYEPEIAGTVASSDRNLYAIQMWDESAPNIPTRAHVNPNAVLFNGYGIPLSADGSPVPDQLHRFQFEDTWRHVNFLAVGTESSYNYGDGCAGAHSIVIVDRQEGMRAHEEYDQIGPSGHSSEDNYVFADVTPIYKENFDDIHKVERKTQLHCDRIFTIEDTFEADDEHLVSSRFILRPKLVDAGFGIKTRTKEGVSIHLFDLLNENAMTTEYIKNHPFKPDGSCVMVDFEKTGASLKRLFIAFLSRDRKPCQRIHDLAVIPDPTEDLSYSQAVKALNASNTLVPMELPAYMESNLPNTKVWWYKKQVTKDKGKSWIILPKGISDPLLFLDGKEVNLSEFRISMELLPSYVPMPEELEDRESIEVVFRTNVPISHYDGGGDGTIGMTGGMWIGYPVEEELVLDYSYHNGEVVLTTNQSNYSFSYEESNGRGGVILEKSL